MNLIDLDINKKSGYFWEYHSKLYNIMFTFNEYLSGLLFDNYGKQMELFQDEHSRLPSDIFKDFLVANNATDIEHIMNIYDESDTYNEFFKNLKKQISTDLLYDLIRHLLLMIF
jgi:hypothetical protein